MSDHESNVAILRASGILFEERSNAVLFREPGRPKVDFYPGSGRWRVVGAANGPTLAGGAKAFLSW
jgi:hypothetical protein